MSNARPEWIFETDAAAMMGYSGRTLRRLVKNGKFNIAYTNPNGRNFQYNKKDIERVLLENSTFIPRRAPHLFRNL